MYNGVGVLTPRGTGTNGHIANNIARMPRPRVEATNWKTSTKDKLSMGRADTEVLEYERKRDIEILVLTWAEDEGILDSDLPQEALDEKYDHARQRFTREYDERKAREEKKIGVKIDENASTHQRAK